MDFYNRMRQILHEDSHLSSAVFVELLSQSVISLQTSVETQKYNSCQHWSHWWSVIYPFKDSAYNRCMMRDLWEDMYKPQQYTLTHTHFACTHAYNYFACTHTCRTWNVSIVVNHCLSLSFLFFHRPSPGSVVLVTTQTMWPSQYDENSPVWAL